MYSQKVLEIIVDLKVRLVPPQVTARTILIKLVTIKLPLYYCNFDFSLVLSFQVSY